MHLESPRQPELPSSIEENFSDIYAPAFGTDENTFVYLDDREESNSTDSSENEVVLVDDDADTSVSHTLDAEDTPVITYGDEEDLDLPGYFGDIELGDGIDTPVLNTPSIDDTVLDTPFVDDTDIDLPNYIGNNESGEDTPIIEEEDIEPPDYIKLQGDTVYRFFETDRQTQFYTTSEVERDNTLQNLKNYRYDGPSFISAPNPETTDITGVIPVYRFLNTNNYVHVYTASEVERDYIENNLPHYVPETDNGISYYGYESRQEGTVPLYRFYNESLGAHFYTPSETERNEFLATPGYVAESENGIAFYVHSVEI